MQLQVNPETRSSEEFISHRKKLQQSCSSYATELLLPAQLVGLEEPCATAHTYNEKDFHPSLPPIPSWPSSIDSAQDLTCEGAVRKWSKGKLSNDSVTQRKSFSVFRLVIGAWWWMSIFVSRHQLGGDSKLCFPTDVQLLESVSNRSQVAQLCLNSEAGKSVLCLTHLSLKEKVLNSLFLLFTHTYHWLVFQISCVAVKQSKKPYFQSKNKIWYISYHLPQYLVDHRAKTTEKSCDAERTTCQTVFSIKWICQQAGKTMIKRES